MERSIKLYNLIYPLHQIIGFNEEQFIEYTVADMELRLQFISKRKDFLFSLAPATEIYHDRNTNEYTIFRVDYFDFSA